MTAFIRGIWTPLRTTVIPLSARNNDRLVEQARRLLEFLESGIAGARLAEVAYTLHVSKRLEYLTLEEWRALDRLRSEASRLTWHLCKSLS